jgi:hypothetical protein
MSECRMYVDFMKTDLDAPADDWNVVDIISRGVA